MIKISTRSSGSECIWSFCQCKAVKLWISYLKRKEVPQPFAAFVSSWPNNRCFLFTGCISCCFPHRMYISAPHVIVVTLPRPLVILWKYLYVVCLPVFPLLILPNQCQRHLSCEFFLFFTAGVHFLFRAISRIFRNFWKIHYLLLMASFFTQQLINLSITPPPSFFFPQ